MKIITKFDSLNLFFTKRLRAERLKASDISNLITMDAHPEVMLTLGGLRTEQQSREVLAWNLKQWEDNGFGIWMFYLSESNEWIGRGGIRQVKINDKKEVELAYMLMPKFWNLGFATEIAKASIEIAFDVIGLDNLVCFTYKTNIASQCVMKKAGFEYECDISRSDRPHVLFRIRR